MNYQEIKKQSQEKYDNLLKDCRVFWAFSDSQFEEGKKQIGFRETDPDEKLCNINRSGFIPSQNVDKMIKGMEEIKKWERAEIKKIKDGKEEHIRHELYNYECFYTDDITDACRVLPYPKKDVYKVYLKERPRALEIHG
jgi:hypothetical protein